MVVEVLVDDWWLVTVSKSKSSGCVSILSLVCDLTSRSIFGYLKFSWIPHPKSMEDDVCQALQTPHDSATMLDDEMLVASQ